MSKKTVFIIVIIVFVFSILISFSSFIFVPSSKERPKTIREEIKERQKAIETDVLYGEEETEKSSIEGVVHKLEASIYMEGTHYLEAGGITLTLLESTYDINLDKYIGKNVKIWGDTRMTIEGDGVITDVKRIEIVD